jgi:hypothetical protein
MPAGGTPRSQRQKLVVGLLLIVTLEKAWLGRRRRHTAH